ncbi:MAG: protein arginine kinase [marine benthic group bacterium]|jgi:protein arginine kinase|nr:protein arginine kinase [Candidatus Benthicola marisminoris]
MMRAGPVGERGLDWIRGGEEAEIVLSSRVRVARNLQGFCFPGRSSDEERADVLERVRAAASRSTKLADGHFWDVADLDSVDRDLLVERHQISRDLVNSAGGSQSAFVMSESDSCGIMVNEEDHLRLQALVGGLELYSAWRQVDQLDEEVGSLLPLAYHHQFGFLTACPTNVGTGLRASVLIHIPGLVLTKEITKVLEGISQVGLNYRGLYGEGSEVVGNFFQVSNQTTLGKGEEDLIDHLGRVAGKVIDYERSARARLLSEAPAVLEDKVWRAYGILRTARSLALEEMMNLLSGVRLGVSLKLLKSPRVETLNEILVRGQSAHLEREAGGSLSEQEADVCRAAFVRDKLATDEQDAGSEPADGFNDAKADDGPPSGG